MNVTEDDYIEVAFSSKAWISGSLLVPIFCHFSNTLWALPCPTCISASTTTVILFPYHSLTSVWPKAYAKAKSKPYTKLVGLASTCCLFRWAKGTLYFLWQDRKAHQRPLVVLNCYKPSTKFHLWRLLLFWQSWLKLENGLKALGSSSSPICTNTRGMPCEALSNMKSRIKLQCHLMNTVSVRDTNLTSRAKTNLFHTFQLTILFSAFVLFSSCCLLLSCKCSELCRLFN